MIRRATVFDKDEILKICESFWEESSYPLTLDIDKMKAVFDQAVDSPDVLMLIKEDDRKVTGVLLATLSSTLFSSDPVAIEAAWYIHPDYRKSVESLKMVKQYEKWAKDQGCKLVCMADLSQLKSLQTVYTKLGYTLTEQTYVKEI